MTTEELDAAGKQMYSMNRSRQSCPPWENLGDDTKSVWIGYALDDDQRTMRLADYYSRSTE